MAESCLFEIRAHERRLLKLRVIKKRLDGRDIYHDGRREVCMREVGLIEVCAREIGSAQTRVPKQTAVNIRALEIRRQKDTSKIQLMEIDFRQVRMAKL